MNIPMLIRDLEEINGHIDDNESELAMEKLGYIIDELKLTKENTNKNDGGRK